MVYKAPHEKRIPGKSGEKKRSSGETVSDVSVPGTGGTRPKVEHGRKNSHRRK